MMYGVRWLLSAKGRLVTIQEMYVHIEEDELVIKGDKMDIIIKYKTHQDCAVVYPYHTVYFHNE